MKVSELSRKWCNISIIAVYKKWYIRVETESEEGVRSAQEPRICVHYTCDAPPSPTEHTTHIYIFSDRSPDMVVISYIINPMYI